MHSPLECRGGLVRGLPGPEGPAEATGSGKDEELDEIQVVHQQRVRTPRFHPQRPPELSRTAKGRRDSARWAGFPVTPSAVRLDSLSGHSEYGESRHDPMVRTANRAVLVEFRRFSALIPVSGTMGDGHGETTRQPESNSIDTVAWGRLIASIGCGSNPSPTDPYRRGVDPITYV